MDDAIFSPHAINAEQSVIGALLLDNSAIDQIGFLHSEHFFRNDNRMLFGVIRSMVADSKPVDIVTLTEELGHKADSVGGIAYIGQLAQSVPTAANIKRYAEMVLDKHLLRMLMAAATKITEIVHEHGGDVAGKINRAQAAVMEMTQTNVGQEPKTLREVLRLAVETIDRRATAGDGVAGLKTGMSDLDDKLGGLKNGDLVIIAARPSMGKTALAVQIAKHVAHDGNPALILSQEMGYQQLMDRMIASSGRINLKNIISGKLENDEWERLTAAFGKLDELPLHIDTQAALTLADVCAKARMTKRKYGLSLVVIDYLQLMSGTGNNRNAQIEEISRGLKSLAKELNIPVIVLSQLSRNCDGRPNKRPVLSDLRDSGAIEQDADVILFIYRDEFYNSDSPDKGTAEVIIGKNRQGETGAVRMSFQGEFSTFADLSDHWSPAPFKRRSKGFD
jgi:replicative DNA helicase